ncbi:MAG: PH domain-containing protein, partial [Planctomycetota bacterium]
SRCWFCSWGASQFSLSGEIGMVESVADTQSTRVFESAIDRWLFAVLISPFFVTAGFGIYLLIDGQADGAVILFLVGAGTMLLTAALAIPCRYTMTTDHLHVRCGITYFRRIPYGKIRSIQPSRSLMNGPALSLNRIAIATPSSVVLVSPKEREQFIEELEKRLSAFSNERSGEV